MLRVLEKSWRRTIDNINTLAVGHAHFATKIAQDLVDPLLQYGNKPEIGRMSMMERNMTQLRRDIETSELRLQKSEQSRSKNKSTKQSEASDESRKLRAKWESEAPNVFERLQQVDENRVAFLRDALVRFETGAIDLYTAQIKSSETAIGSLLEVSPADEVMDFVSKRLNQDTTTSLRRPTAASRTASSGDTGSIRSSSGASSSLKSKFGTLLKGKGSGSPNKRQSILPKFLGSGPTRQTLAETKEEAESEGAHSSSRPPANEHRSFTNNNGFNANQNTVPYSSESTGNGDSRSQMGQRVDSVHGVKESVPDTEGSNSAEEQITTLHNSIRSVNIQSGTVNTSTVDEDNAAIDRVSSTLRAQPTISKRSRGRRDVRSTFYDSSAEAGTGNIIRDVLGSPLPRQTPILDGVGQPPVDPVDSVTNRAAQGLAINRQNTLSAFSNDGTESIRSSRSYTAGQSMSKHTEPIADGVHVSVVETVNASIAVDGNTANLSVFGEIAMCNRHSVDDLPLQLQLTSPDPIDRVVHNSQLLKRLSETSFEVGAAAISRMSVLLKYQVSPDVQRQARFLPILLMQRWSIEEQQTSVKLTYRLNPLFGASSLILHDVEVSVSIDGIATSCVAKPAGTFVKRSSRLVWRLNELSLESSTEGSLLARFKTETICKPTDVVDLKFRTASSNIIRGSGLGVSVTKLRDNPFADTPNVENVLVHNSFALQSGRFSVSTDIKA